MNPHPQTLVQQPPLPHNHARYNVLNELTGVSQGLQTRTYAYDALGRLTSTTTPEAGLLCFGTKTGSACNADGYDSFDNLLYRTDARGVLTTYGYDTLNRLSGISYNVGTSGVPATPGVTFTYGTTAAQFNNGRLITMTDGVGSENYSYNSLGQTTHLQKVINSTAYTVDYAYNLAGELTSITYPSGRIVQQNVDTIGRLSSIVGTFNSVNTTYASGFAYNSAFQTTALQYGNGIFASFGFSADRLLLNCLDYSTTSRGGACAHDATTKFGLNYSYPVAGSNNGQIAGITDSVDNGRSATYSYDALYRLTSAVTTGSATYPQWGLSFAYDRYGNRWAQNVTAGTGVPSNSVQVDATTNHITTAGYVYDANGNMTNDGNNTLVYDAENRTVSATNGGASGAYTFDGNSLRVKKVSGATTTVYIFSGSKVIAEYENGAAPGSPTREYIYSGSTLLAKIDSSGTKYYHQDHLSNRVVTDSSGNVAAQLGHYPFGESWYNSTGDKLLFTSYERDSESSNDYAMMRSYVNRLARFSSPDPISGSTSDPQSLNKYAYVRGDPINLADPTGLGYCFGYWVIRITVDAETGEIISSDVLGFIPIYCWGDGGGGGGGDGPGLDGGFTGGPLDMSKVLQMALAALLNQDCAELFGGFANAITAMFGSSYNRFVPGQQNPFPNQIRPSSWDSITNALTSGQHDASTQPYPGRTGGWIFFTGHFNGREPSFAGSSDQVADMTLFFHELEHAANNYGPGGSRYGALDRAIDSNYQLDAQKINERCKPFQVEPESIPITGRLTPP